VRSAADKAEVLTLTHRLGGDRVRPASSSSPASSPSPPPPPPLPVSSPSRPTPDELLLCTPPHNRPAQRHVIGDTPSRTTSAPPAWLWGLGSPAGADAARGKVAGVAVGIGADVVELWDVTVVGEPLRSEVRGVACAKEDGVVVLLAGGTLLGVPLEGSTRSRGVGGGGGSPFRGGAGAGAEDEVARRNSRHGTLLSRGGGASLYACDSPRATMLRWRRRQRLRGGASDGVATVGTDGAEPEPAQFNAESIVTPAESQRRQRWGVSLFCSLFFHTNALLKTSFFTGNLAVRCLFIWTSRRASSLARLCFTRTPMITTPKITTPKITTLSCSCSSCSPLLP
jgi:hypothetical protein